MHGTLPRGGNGKPGMDKHSGMHESYDRHDDVVGSSDRAFGYTFAVVFGLIGASSYFFGGGNWPYWWGGAALFGAIAAIMPSVLAPLNRLWLRFGMLLYKVVNPIVLFVLYATVIVPIAMLMRLFGKRPLQLEIDKGAESYWQSRTPPGPAPETMRNQF
jgi:hypothetical protein